MFVFVWQNDNNPGPNRQVLAFRSSRLLWNYRGPRLHEAVQKKPLPHTILSFCPAMANFALDTWKCVEFFDNGPDPHLWRIEIGFFCWLQCNHIPAPKLGILLYSHTIAGMFESYIVSRQYPVKNIIRHLWRNIMDKPKSQSKVEVPNLKSQIKKGKGEFGLWAVIKILWVPTQWLRITPSTWLTISGRTWDSPPCSRRTLSKNG